MQFYLVCLQQQEKPKTIDKIFWLFFFLILYLIFYLTLCFVLSFSLSHDMFVSQSASVCVSLSLLKLCTSLSLSSSFYFFLLLPRRIFFFLLRRVKHRVKISENPKTIANLNDDVFARHIGRSFNNCYRKKHLYIHGRSADLSK